MGTFDELQVGERFTSPPRTITDDDVAALIRIGGYTHPLFTDPAFAASTPFGRTPLPGEAILHLMGGLAEQTERFDDTVIALVGFEHVRFIAPVFAGDTLRLEIQVDEKHYTGRGDGLMMMTWLCLNQDDRNVTQAEGARMLFRIDPLEGAPVKS